MTWYKYVLHIYVFVSSHIYSKPFLVQLIKELLLLQKLRSAWRTCLTKPLTEIVENEYVPMRFYQMRFNPLILNGPFLYPLKKSENLAG